MDGFTDERKATISRLKLLTAAQQGSALRRECLRGDFEQFENLLLAHSDMDVAAANKHDGVTPLMEAARRSCPDTQ
eukprot:SAG31_NODE_12721_length_921_cov_1.363747_1_plen_75_part_10